MGIGNRVTKSNNTMSTEAEMKQPETPIRKDIIKFESQKPKYSFDEIILSQKIKDELLDLLSYKQLSGQVFDKWGLDKTHKFSKKIGINLYGEPGTGKTMAAHAIADYLNRNIIVVSYADIESKYVGETPKNIRAAFEAAKESNSILFFDEADAILSKRVTEMKSSTDVSVNQTRSVMLMLLNEYQDVIIFATNFISNFDQAFMRRILGHVKFELPDYACRKQIWNISIPKALPHNLDFHDVSIKYDGISGSDVSNAVLKAAFKAARKGDDFVDAVYFEEAIEGIIESKKANQKVHNNTTVEDRIVDEQYVKDKLAKTAN